MGAGAGAWAGNQQYQPLAASVQAALHAAVADQAPLDASFQRSAERARWL
ncbi:MAG: lytic transglycosylase domain-containing protein, partial [Zoogloea sp.]|nr:lytic transglycosylase domain-containing protein [Zoogloea sp.]